MPKRHFCFYAVECVISDITIYQLEGYNKTRFSVFLTQKFSFLDCDGGTLKEQYGKFMAWKRDNRGTN